MKIFKPTQNEYNAQSQQNIYVQAVTSENALQTMAENISIVDNFFKSLPVEKYFYRYAEGKWTPLEVLGHLIDCERILAYRAMCIARGEKQSLPGFEEADYVNATNFNKKSLRSLLLQYKAQRKSTILLFKSFSQRELSRIGLANNWSITPRAIAWIIAGHELHHLNILKERYL
ncbi:DinB family protein [Emticicia sp. 17c]|uniref:DinB family protein n=1 Tax=Emticicia sp. 17c TaxID=3127704 RepID=UPI00301E0142